MVLIQRSAARFLSATVFTAVLQGLLAQPPVDAARTIRDGVYTAEQARRGQAAYTGPCDRCHGYKLDGASDDPDMLPAPPVAGPKLLRNWSGRSVFELFAYVRATMPANNPGYLSDAEVVDIVAYMLATSGMPPGQHDLPPDAGALASIVIASGL